MKKTQGNGKLKIQNYVYLCPPRASILTKGNTQ